MPTTGHRPDTDGATLLRNRAHDYVYVQNNSRHLRFTGTTAWFDWAVASSGADRAVYPLLRADSRARRLLRRLDNEVRMERARLLPGLSPMVMSATDAASAEMLLRRLLTRVDDPVARRRLARAWRAGGSSRWPAAVGILDELAELRRSAARAAGAACPADVSRLEDGTLPSADEVTAFVESYACDATTRHQLFVEALGAVGDDHDALTNYPVYVRQRVAGGPSPQLHVARAVELAARIIGTCLDGPIGTAWFADHVLLSLCDHEGLPVGHVQLDLSLGGRTVCADSLVGSPVGRVLIRCAPSGTGPIMSYEAFFLFVHEIGHALTHVLRSAQSVYRGPWAGLTYGPVLHTESVSTLIEKVALHPDLASWFRLANHERAALSARQRLSALEFLRNEAVQVAVARADDQLHGPDARPVGTGGRTPVDACFPQAWQVAPYIVTQLAARHPGVGAVAYLVANAYSCTVFKPLRDGSFGTCLSSIAAEIAGVLLADRWPSPAIPASGPVSAVYLPALAEES